MNRRTPVSGEPPIVRHLEDVVPRLISPADTVRLATLVRPADGTAASVFFEVWEPGGSQPPNSHPGSAEIFVVLRGTGRAYSDGHVAGLRAGDVLVLPPGSVHRIENTSATERLYAVTIMADDQGALPGGFAALVDRGTPVSWEDADRDVLASGTRPRAGGRAPGPASSGPGLLRGLVEQEVSDLGAVKPDPVGDVLADPGSGQLVGLLSLLR
jgi:quercetin dioxygenase-like cupin family protein